MTNLDEKVLEEMDYSTFVKIISNIPSCIFYKDKDLKYRFSSHCWMQLISEDIVGKTDLDIRKDKENAIVAMEADREILRTKKGCSYVIKSEIDGVVSYLELIKEPIFGDDGEAIGIVGLINDVTEKTIMEQKILEMTKDLEEKCKELESTNEELHTSLEMVQQLHSNHKLFTASMNHELRSPLNGIIGLLQLLIDDDTLKEQQHEHVFNAYQSAQMMLSIVNELLDFAKMETDEFTIKHEVFDLFEVLHNIKYISQNQAKSKNLSFELRIRDGVSQKYIGDEIRIRQIMHNFISNSIKYSEKGQVCLDVSFVNGRLKMTCSDQGQGMSEESVNHMFDPFTRFNEKKNATIQGTGLGLSVVKKIIDKMNGEIQVHSEIGVGTTITAFIPVDIWKDECEDCQNHSHINTKQTEISFENLSILCVDDTKVNLTVLEAMLHSFGVKNITKAASGKEAIPLTNENHYHLIFMDHQMPEMDGIEVFHEIREKSSKNKETPVVMLTGNASVEYAELYRSEGTDGYLVKPVLKDKLMNIIQTVVD